MARKKGKQSTGAKAVELDENELGEVQGGYTEVEWTYAKGETVGDDPTSSKITSSGHSTTIKSSK